MINESIEIQLNEFYVQIGIQHFNESIKYSKMKHHLPDAMNFEFILGLSTGWNGTMILRYFHRWWIEDIDAIGMDEKCIQHEIRKGFGQIYHTNCGN